MIGFVDRETVVDQRKSVARAVVVTPEHNIALAQRSLVRPDSSAAWQWSLPGGKYDPRRDGPLAHGPLAIDVLIKELGEEFGLPLFSKPEALLRPFTYGGWKNYVFVTYATYGSWTVNEPGMPKIKTFSPREILKAVAVTKVVRATPLLSWLRKLDERRSRLPGSQPHQLEKNLAERLIAFNHGDILRLFLEGNSEFKRRQTERAAQLVRPYGQFA